MKPPAKIQLPEFKVIYHEQEKLASGTLIRAKLCLKHHLWDGSSLQNMSNMIQETLFWHLPPLDVLGQTMCNATARYVQDC